MSPAWLTHCFGSWRVDVVCVMEVWEETSWRQQLCHGGGRCEGGQAVLRLCGGVLQPLPCDLATLD